MPFKVQKIIVYITLVLISLAFAYRYTRGTGIYYGDSLGYYMYLPGTFIYGNVIEMYNMPDTTIPQHIRNDGKQMSLNITPIGKAINQYTYGVALMEIPFFLLAHAYSILTGSSTNGYTDIYEMGVRVSTIFYCIAGMYFIYRVLRRYFTKSTSLLTIALIYIGTNLFWFTVHQAGMAHVPLFFLYTLLIWLTIKMHENGKALNFALMGLTVGLITIIRPTDIICIIIPICYGVYNRETIKWKISFIKENILKLLLLVIVFLIPLIPQLLYWKAVSGHYIYYSYGEQGFDWAHPHIIEGLFGFNNGWLVYSPVMIFSILGIILYKYVKDWAWVIWIILPIYIYIIYSWYCYNYINGLGSRPMIHLYPLLAIPFAAFIQYISKKRWVLKVITIALVTFFISLNISYSMQQATRILLSQYSNMAFNMQTMFKMHLDYSDMVAFDIAEMQPDTNNLKKIKTLACVDFESSTDTTGHYGYTSNGNRYFEVKDGEEYPPIEIKIKYRKEELGSSKWLKCSGRFLIPSWPPDSQHSLLVFSVQSGNEYKKWQGLKIFDRIGIADGTCSHKEFNLDHWEMNKWGYIYFFTTLPENIEEGDEVKVNIWNMSNQKMLVDNICIEAYQ